MPKIHLVVEKAPEGSYIAKAINEDIFTKANDVPGLYTDVRDAVI